MISRKKKSRKRVISREKLSANQANAQNSTGPATPEGKAISAQNARTHGLCAKDLLIAGEDHEEFESMQLKLQDEIGPKGELEQTLFGELVTASWQLRRIGRMETELSAGHPSYKALLEDEILQKKLDRLARHHTRFERTLHRCLKELKALQTNRAQRAEAFQENFLRPALAPAVPRPKDSKRTHPAIAPEPEEPMSAEESAELESIFLEMDKRFGIPTEKIDDDKAA